MVDVPFLRQEILDKMVNFPHLTDYEKRIHAVFYREAGIFYDEYLDSDEYVENNNASSNGKLYLTGEDTSVVLDSVVAMLDELGVPFELDVIPSDNVLMVCSVNANRDNVVNELEEIRALNFPKIVCIYNLDYATNDTTLWIYENLMSFGEDTLMFLESSDTTDTAVIMGLEQVDATY